MASLPLFYPRALHGMSPTSDVQIILTLSTAYTSHTYSLVVYRPNTLGFDSTRRTKTIEGK